MGLSENKSFYPYYLVVKFGPATYTMYFQPSREKVKFRLLLFLFFIKRYCHIKYKFMFASATLDK